MDIKLKKILDDFGVITKNCDNFTNIREDLNFDSLEQVELIYNIEKEFNIVITDNEAEELLTIGDVEKLINKKL